MRLPRVSHIIIAYQQERYVEEAVLSAARQDYDALEVIVADDGSTDGTRARVREMAAQFPAGRIVLVDGPNLGVTGNSNRGLRAAKGDLVSFQGGDDVLLPGKIRTQVDWFAKNPDAALSAHPVETFYDDGARPPHLTRPATTSGIGPEVFIAEGPPFAATSVMVRSAAIPSRGFDERLPLLSDWKLWIDVLAGGARFGSVDETLARYRVHPGNVSSRRREKMDQDSFYTLTLVELEYPQFHEATRRGRAMLNEKCAAIAWEASDYDTARRYLAASLRSRPRLSGFARLAACSLPPPTLDALRALWRRTRQARQ